MAQILVDSQKQAFPFLFFGALIVVGDVFHELHDCRESAINIVIDFVHEVGTFALTRWSASMTYRALGGAVCFFMNFGIPKLVDETLWRLLVVPSFPKLYRTLTELFWIK